MERGLVDRNTIEKYKKKIEKCQTNKEKALSYIHQLKDKVVKRELAYSEYEEILEKKLRGKTLHEWLDYYDSYIKACEKRIKKERNKKIKRKIFISLSLFLTIAFLFTIAFYLRPSLTGFAVKAPSQEFIQPINFEFSSSQEYELQLESLGILQSVKLSGSFQGLGEVKVYLDNLLILDSNNLKQKSKPSLITGFAVSEEALQQTPFQEEPLPSSNETNSTKETNITGNETPPVILETPSNATQSGQSIENITPITPEQPQSQLPEEQIIEFNDICEETCNLRQLNLNKPSYTIRIEVTNAKLFLKEIKYEILQEIPAEIPKNITTIENITTNITEPEIPQNITNITEENITFIQGSAEINKPVKWKAQIKSDKLENAGKFVPKTASGVSGKQIDYDIFELDYETPSPSVKEEKTKKGKRINLSGAENLTYENVKTYANIPELTKDKTKIKVYWLENNSFIEFNASDTNNNELIDYVEFIAPSTGQTYEIIIEISKAEHLDENRNFISDIYEQVKSLDNIWSEPINTDEYVRVTFEQKLTPQNDITIYARNTKQENTLVEVYEKDSQEKIAEFPIITKEDYYKIFLTNMKDEQDTFDLKIKNLDNKQNAFLEFDFIIDPNGNTLTIGKPVTLCGEVANYSTIYVNSSGTLVICAYNGTKGTGYVNISLGKYGNFTVASGGKVEGAGMGSRGGAGASGTANACSTQGENGGTYGTAGSAACTANGGGGAGGARAANSNTLGGGGGGFAGAGGKGGYDAVDIAGTASGTYGSATDITLVIGSGGAGESGDLTSPTGPGSPGGAGIKVNASSGVIFIQGIINVSGKKGTAGDATDDSGGGGGSGGHIILIANNTNLNNGIINASGGEGGDSPSGTDTCGGGGGGGGRIVYVYGAISLTGLKNETIGGKKGVGRNAACDAETDAGTSVAGANGTTGYVSSAFPVPDLSAPNLSIITPSNNSFLNYQTVNINYTIQDPNLEECWYTNDTRTFNYSITNCANITTVIWSVGQHNVSVYANDTWGNSNSSHITFNVDTTAPDINLTYPLNTTYTINVNQLNYTAGNDATFCMYYNGTSNATITTCGQNLTGLISAEGSNTWIVYANDSGNNQNSSSVTFVKDTQYPIFSLFLDNNATYSGQLARFNVTITSTNGTVQLNLNATNYTANNLTATVFNVTINLTATGDYNYSWLSWGNGSLNNYNTSSLRWFSVNPTPDNTPPTFTNMLANISYIYPGTGVSIDFNATDTESPISSFTVNQTDKFNITSSGGWMQNITTLNAGLWNVNVSVNDTSGNTGFLIYTIEVNKSNSANVTLYLDGLTQNRSVFSGTKVWLNATLITGDTGAYIQLYENGTLVNNGTSPVTNYTNFTTLGDHNISALYLGSVNYSAKWALPPFYVSVNQTVTNTPPQIIYVQNETLSSGVDPIEETAREVQLNITIYDINGFEDTNANSVNINFTNSGITRINTSCIPVINFSTNYANYSCKVNMWYFDSIGKWNITAYAEDSYGEKASNTTTSFSYNQLQSIKINPKSISFSNANIGATNITSINPTTINNTGNYNASGKVAVNAINLHGQTTISEFINVKNFSVGLSTGGNPPAECLGTLMTNGSDATITSSVLEAGNLSASQAQEQLYYCINIIPKYISSQTYSTLNAGSWTIKILLSLILIPKSRKKKKKLVKDDKLMKALILIADELRQEYSLNKKELAGIIIEKLKEKYKISRKEIREIIAERNVPATIFSSKLGALESLVKYMKENLNMSYHEIALLLKRNDRTIWTAYKKAKEKQREPIKAKETSEFLPISIFKDRNLTVLESLILHLKEKGAKNKEIAELIERDQRNISTIYSRAIKKIRRKVYK